MTRSRRWLSAAALTTALTAAALLAIGLAAVFLYQRWQERGPSFQDSFSGDLAGQPHKGGWQAFGGTWQVVDGTMQNISDDRGARLMNGSGRWHNYVVDVDIQLLGEAGDAGILLRSSQEETGVDSYHGYFAGVRDTDDTLILGRADFGWHEFQTIPVHSGMHTRTWYHLRFLAHECTLVAIATSPTGETTRAMLQEPACIARGRFGLQSYATGAAWRNLTVRPATQQDLQVMLSTPESKEPGHPITEQGSADPWSEMRFIQPMWRELQDHKTDPNALSIASLRLLAPDRPFQVTIHGVVTLVSPILFVQDATGGVAVPGAHTDTPVQIGDSVEVRGNSEQHDFSSVLRDANVRLLWSHTPVPPVSVTAAQAATGAFDAQYIETEGRLISEQADRGDSADLGNSMELKLDEGSQSFVAIAESPSLAESLKSLKPGSRLRVRGVCVTDRAFARNEIPFALLMRSVDDAQMIEPPPWWSRRHLIELAVALLAVSFGMHSAYASVKRSQLRAVIEERERLALEMHDTLAQSYAGLGFQLEALSSQFDAGSAMHSQLESTVEMVRIGHTEARRNIAALRPESLEKTGLPNALEDAAHAIVHGGPIAIWMSVRGEPRPIPLRVGDALFRIGQEAIANAVRHGHPRAIQLRLAYGRPSVRLTVHDNGQGFCTLGEAAGFGIRGMKRRAENINASLRIRSSPGHGTSVLVRASLPHTPLASWWRGIALTGKWKRGRHGNNR
jgi:signal transduction histidine kinase